MNKLWNERVNPEPKTEFNLTLKKKEVDVLFQLFHGNTQGEMDWNDEDLQEIARKIELLVYENLKAIWYKD